MQGCIAVLHAGSSSIKLGLYEIGHTDRPLLRGQIDGLGTAPKLRVNHVRWDRGCGAGMGRADPSCGGDAGHRQNRKRPVERPAHPGGWPPSMRKGAGALLADYLSEAVLRTPCGLVTLACGASDKGGESGRDSLRWAQLAAVTTCPSRVRFCPPSAIVQSVMSCTASSSSTTTRCEKRCPGPLHRLWGKTSRLGSGERGRSATTTRQ